MKPSRGHPFMLKSVYYVHSSKIANTFRDLNARLYHLPDTLPGSTGRQKTESISQYLEDAQFPQIFTQTKNQLDAPISLTEPAAVIKDLPKGKSRGQTVLQMLIIVSFTRSCQTRCVSILTRWRRVQLQPRRPCWPLLRSSLKRERTIPLLLIIGRFCSSILT